MDQKYMLVLYMYVQDAQHDLIEIVIILNYPSANTGENKHSFAVFIMIYSNGILHLPYTCQQQMQLDQPAAHQEKFLNPCLGRAIVINFGFSCCHCHCLPDNRHRYNSCHGRLGA